MVAQRDGFQPPEVWPLAVDQSLPHTHPDWIANAGASLAEDICILDVADELRLVAGCLAAPSYWRLHDKIGLPLWDIHRLVDGLNKRLGARIQQFLQRIEVGQPFTRSNWFLHGDAEYFHNRPERPAELGDDPNSWIIRSERQVLCRFTEQYLVFTIRVRFKPLAEIFHHPRARRTAAAHPASAMNTDEIIYFGGSAKHRRLLEYVGG